MTSPTPSAPSHPDHDPDAPWRLDATTLADQLRSRRLSATTVVRSCLDRITAWDDLLFGFISVAADQALAAAAVLDQAPVPVGRLHGVPVAIKDLTDVAGQRTTRGSILCTGDPVPTLDDPFVARLRAAGAIIIGKTNTPDFGFGSICTSTIRGATRTPHDLRLSSEGSSGGSAAAVAAGFVPLATGGDFGGSLRTPASFCGIVSIRPTPGVIPDPVRALAWSNLATDGPMARTVADAALLLSVMAGTDSADPLSGLERHTAPSTGALRVGVSEDLGVAPVAAEARHLFRRAVDRIDDAFGPVVPVAPDCGEAMATFLTLRAGLIHHGAGPLKARFGDRLPASVRWNIDRGHGLSAEAYLAAEAARGRLYRSFMALFAQVDVLVLPAAAVMPFPAEVTDVTAVDGVPLDTIVDYYAITFIISLLGCPVVTVPCGWSDAGLPLGLQIIGPPYNDAAVIATAERFERDLSFRHRWPALSRC